MFSPTTEQLKYMPLMPRNRQLKVSRRVDLIVALDAIEDVAAEDIAFPEHYLKLGFGGLETQQTAGKLGRVAHVAVWAKFRNDKELIEASGELGVEHLHEHEDHHSAQHVVWQCIQVRGHLLWVEFGGYSV
jgi:hypothetical protein